MSTNIPEVLDVYHFNPVYRVVSKCFVIKLKVNIMIVRNSITLVLLLSLNLPGCFNGIAAKHTRDPSRHTFQGRIPSTEIILLYKYKSYRFCTQLSLSKCDIFYSI